MFSKNRPSLPSDAQTKEKLAIYVYEYLLHSGAQKAAQTFLQEIRWEKNIPIGDAPGFLHLWWGVFWDIYCAAPERRELFEHSAEAKAYHDYGFVPNPNFIGVSHGPNSGPPLSVSTIPGEQFRPMFLPNHLSQRLPSPMFPIHPASGAMMWSGGVPGPMLLPGGPHGPPPRPFLMRGAPPPHMQWISGPPNMCSSIPPHSMVLLPPSSPNNAPQFMMASNAAISNLPPGGLSIPQMNGGGGGNVSFYNTTPNGMNIPSQILPPQQQQQQTISSQCFPSSSGTPGPAGSGMIPPSPHDSGVSSQGPDVYTVSRRGPYFPGSNGTSCNNGSNNMPSHELMTPMSMSSSDLNAMGSGPAGSGQSSGCFMPGSPSQQQQSSLMVGSADTGGGTSGSGSIPFGLDTVDDMVGGGISSHQQPPSVSGPAAPPSNYYDNDMQQQQQHSCGQSNSGPYLHHSTSQIQQSTPIQQVGNFLSFNNSGTPDNVRGQMASVGSGLPLLQNSVSSSSMNLMENSYNSPVVSIEDMNFSDQKDSMAIQKLKESMQEEVRIFELSREVIDSGEYFMAQQG